MTVDISGGFGGGAGAGVCSDMKQTAVVVEATPVVGVVIPVLGLVAV